MTAKAIIEDIVLLSEDKKAPVLLDLRNGMLNVEATNKLKYVTAINEGTKEKEAVLAVNGHIYHGPIKVSYPTESLNTFIAVRNKTTNKVRLIQVEQASMINSIYDHNKTDLNATTQEDKKALLIKNFGGRSAIRNFERTERMKVSLDSVKDQLEKTADSTNIEETPKKDIYEEDLANISPPFNKDAKKVEDVYSLYDLVPKELMDNLNQEAEAVLGSKVEDIPFTSEFTKIRIKEIKSLPIPSSNQNLNIVKALIYLDALGNVIKSKGRDLTKTSISNISEKVETNIRELFCQPDISQRLSTSYTKNKATCYYIALSLLISPKYEVSLPVLMQDLCMPRIKLLKFANFIKAKTNRTDRLRLELPESIKPMQAFVKKRRFK